MIIDDIPVGVEPEGMGLTNNGKILVNTSETTNMAHFIDTNTLEILKMYLLMQDQELQCLHQMIKKFGFLLKLEVLLKSSTLIKKVTHTIGFEIPGVNEESIQPVGVKHTNDGKYTFVALGPANRIAVIDQKTKK